MIPVTFLGYQEKFDGTKFLLVNEVDSHSTVIYDKKKHYLVPKKENKNAKSQTRQQKL